jgi:prophage tail gpP-like protein
VLVVPNVPGAPQDLARTIPSSNETEVAILIDGKRFRFWSEVRVTRSIDAMDTVEFSAPFDSKIPNFKATFRPFSYKDVDIIVGGSRLFSGTMVGVTPTVSASQKVVSVSAYSKPGVLNDCTLTGSSYPLEFNDQNLRDIAKSIADTFGIAVDFRVDPGPVFERVSLKPSKKVLPFLSELAQQRNMIISSSEDGALIFWRSIDPGTPVASLSQGASPLTQVTPFFSPQEYYSHITGIDPVLIGLEGSQFTVKNPRLNGVVRPITFSPQDTIDSDVQDAVQAKASRMFGNMASYSASVSSWNDPSGNLWKPNTSIKLFANDAMVYGEYEFIIRSVELIKDSRSESAVLNLVIPGSFSGKLPEVLPWEL